MCTTNFFDLIEIMPSYGHPVGRHNTITLDNAVVNILMSLLSIGFLLIGVSGVALPAFFYGIAAIAYLVQLLETILYSSTLRTLWQQNKWIDFEVFKVWFYELKKCRPKLTFVYEPTQEEQEAFQKYQQINRLDDYTELKLRVVK